jgi:hypothetical protein
VNDTKNGLTFEELRPCDICKQPLTRPRGPDSPMSVDFFVFRVDRHLIDVGALQRLTGLAQFFGGGGPGFALAGIMGPDRHGSVVFDEGEPIIVCQACCYADPSRNVSLHTLAFPSESGIGPKKTPEETPEEPR